ncbi:MAG: ORF6N domain-containing protein, partial [Candidatus Paceibacterota bacterium]
MSDTDIIISKKIHIIRGQKVMLDFDLAILYQTQTKVLNQSVKRNVGRFPEDFSFFLTLEEEQNLKSQ